MDDYFIIQSYPEEPRSASEPTNSQQMPDEADEFFNRIGRERNGVLQICLAFSSQNYQIEEISQRLRAFLQDKRARGELQRFPAVFCVGDTCKDETQRFASEEDGAWKNAPTYRGFQKLFERHCDVGISGAGVGTLRDIALSGKPNIPIPAATSEQAQNV